MQEKKFIIVIFVLIAVIFGLLFSQHNSSVFTMRKDKDGKLVLVEDKGPKYLGLGTNLKTVLRNQQILEKRISVLEEQVKNIQSFFKRVEAGSPPVEDYSKVYDIDIGYSPVMGKKDALVTVVEFLDFQCPYCAKFHFQMTEAVKAYPEKVNYVVKNFPLNFHKNAESAAKAAFAALEQGKYFEMVDALLKNSKNLNEDKYKELAENLGLDMEKFLKDYKEKNEKWQSYIEKDKALGVKVDVKGTPSYYINGRKTRARNAQDFKKEIGKILTKEKW